MVYYHSQFDFITVFFIYNRYFIFCTVVGEVRGWGGIRRYK